MRIPAWAVLLAAAVTACDEPGGPGDSPIGEWGLRSVNDDPLPWILVTPCRLSSGVSGTASRVDSARLAIDDSQFSYTSYGACQTGTENGDPVWTEGGPATSFGTYERSGDDLTFRWNGAAEAEHGGFAAESLWIDATSGTDTFRLLFRRLM